MFTAASVPVKVIAASAVPSPTVNVNPVSVVIVSVPFVTLSWIWIAPPPASGSATETAFAPVKVSAVSSFTDSAPGTVFTGGSFTLLIVTVNAFSTKRPPASVERTRIE